MLGNEPVRYNSAALARDLSGAHAADFDDYEFVRGLLGEVGELDGNAALSALDGVEHMLRKRRAIAASDEAFAREQLRVELRHGLRKRDEALRVIEVAGKHGEAGESVVDLRNAMAVLDERVMEHSRLCDARDVVRLLQGEEMSVERSTEILALLRMEDRKGTLVQVLGDEKHQEAKLLIDRAEEQLALRNVQNEAEDETEAMVKVASPIRHMKI